MFLDKEKLDKINILKQNGEKITRKNKILYQNIEGVRKAGIKYSHNYDELNEYAKCKNDIFYFVDNYCNIKLRDYQRDILKMYYENRFSLCYGSRQIGKELLSNIYVLWFVLFPKEKIVYMINHKTIQTIENLNKIKEIYKNLPFFLKKGVMNWNQKYINFEDNSKIITLTKSVAVGHKIDLLIMSDFGNLNTKFYNMLIPSVLSYSDSKIIISGSSLNKLFKELLLNSQKPDGDPSRNAYSSIICPWNVVENRDEKWKNEQIKLIGKDSFKKEYECKL